MMQIKIYKIYSQYQLLYKNNKKMNKLCQLSRIKILKLWGNYYKLKKKK